MNSDRFRRSLRRVLTEHYPNAPVTTRDAAVDEITYLAIAYAAGDDPDVTDARQAVLLREVAP